jgi:hypothetical protein
VLQTWIDAGSHRPLGRLGDPRLETSQPIPDHPAVPVIREDGDVGLSLLELLARVAQTTLPEVAVAQVEVQARRQVRDVRYADGGQGVPLEVGKLLERGPIPGDLLVERVLEVGEIVRQDAAVGVLDGGGPGPAGQQSVAARRPVTGLRLTDGREERRPVQDGQDGW